jgi:hypothetical protein
MGRAVALTSLCRSPAKPTPTSPRSGPQPIWVRRRAARAEGQLSSLCRHSHLINLDPGADVLVPGKGAAIGMWYTSRVAMMDGSRCRQSP